MSKLTGQGPRGGFRRCGRCGTPNPTASYLTQCIGCGARVSDVALAEPTTEAAGATTIPSAGRERFGRVLSVLTWAYAASVFAVLITMWSLGDRWWPATLLLLMPRALWLIPVGLLSVATLFRRGRRRGLLLVQAAIALVILGPLMNLHIPWERGLRGAGTGTALRIMTLNRASRLADPEKIAALVERERIEVICFQEIEGVEPSPAFLSGWHSNHDGSLYSRHPIVETFEPSELNEFPEYGFWPLRHARASIRLPSGEAVVIGTAHMPTPRSGVKLYLAGDRSAAARYLEWRWTQIGALARVLVETRDRPTVFGCDLNTTSDSPLVGILQEGYRVGFDQAGWGYGYTRPAAFPWAAIDHILVSRHFEVRSCRVGPDVGSDHLPVIAEVVLGPAGASGDR